MFTCPNCDTLAADYPDAGVVTVACTRCTYMYELSAGTVAAFASRGVEIRPAKHGESALNARRFELTLSISARERLRFTFGSERSDDWIHLKQGDEAVVVYGMRNGRRAALLYVLNRSTSARFVIGAADASTKNLAALISGAAALVGGGAAIALALPGPVAVLSSIALFAGTFLVARPLLRPTHALPPDQRAMLTARQQLLEEKRSLLRLRTGVLDETDTRVTLRRRLDELRARMIAVKIDAYASRIEAIDRAMRTLDEQLDVDRQLLAEYDRTLEIIDIEHDVSLAADTLPTDAGMVMETRRQELRAAEERRAETTRRLAANAEVEQLLGRDG